MGRSSAEQAQQNREKIVEVAGQLFRERGVEAVSVAEVMAAAGMTVGGFYRHFASKEALADEASDHAFRTALTIWQRALKPSPEGADSRLRLVERYLRPDPARQCPVVAFARHASYAEDTSQARNIYGDGTAALLQALSDSFENRAADDEANQAILILFAAMVGTRVIAEAAGDVPWVDDLKKAVIATASRATRT